jgi:glycogen(starch) synthase
MNGKEAVVKKADVVLEVSFEVCNKVGGIYTVLMSKAMQAVKHYENYFCIGPYFHQKVIGEFEEEVPSENLKKVFDDCKALGIICHYGNWLVKGNPKTILIDFQGYYSKTNEIKGKLWNSFKIDSLNCPQDVNEPITWSHATGVLIEKLATLYPGKKIVAQFHEWLSSAGLLHLKMVNAPVATVFTTHATMLGRSIASSRDLYSILDKIDPDREAYNYGIWTKYQLEKQGAWQAEIFTTVSEITGIEAEHILKKKPDVLLPNGLDMEEFPSFEDVSIKHSEMKFRFKEFILYYFFPYYAFDLDETYILFTFARYEFHNKGADVFLKALAKLNNKLKEENSKRTFVAFFFIPAGIKNIKPELVENREYYGDVKESVDGYKEKIRNNILINLLSQKRIAKETIFPEEFLSETKKKILRFAKGGKPFMCTHDLFDEGRDPILNLFRETGLDNLEDDRVKVVFYPTYMSGADGLLDLSYYDAIIGGHMGVFPSIYEPWGYTPLEAGALGVASVTTDLAGFGRFINQQRPKDICNETSCDLTKEQGIFVCRRHNKTDEETVDELFNVLYFYSTLSKEDRINNKIEARRLAGLADWKHLFSNYTQAYNAAVDKKWS